MGRRREGIISLFLCRPVALSPLVQLTLSIAAANFTNRVNEALGTELET
jgi:hypothetical protein